MPAQPLPGDQHMPRVQGEAFGASQRLVVSPGREAQGSLQCRAVRSIIRCRRSTVRATPRGCAASRRRCCPAPRSTRSPCAQLLLCRRNKFRPILESSMSARFNGTDSYVATEDLMMAVNAAVTLGPSAAGEGRARHRQDAARGGNRGRAAAAAVPLAHQVDDQGAAGPVRIRRRVAPARFAARRGEGARHRQLHHQGPDVGGVRERSAAGAAGRRDRQGRHRVSERPAARARPDGVLRVRDAPVDQGAAPPDHRHHQQQREGAAGRVPAPLLLPLHPLPRHRDDGAHRRRALSEPEEGAAGARR